MVNKTYKSVMLVDDNDVDNYISQRMIELSNFSENVLVKNNGKSALEFLEQNQNSPELLPDIIFLDISMPIVDGYVFLYEFEKYSDVLKNKSKVVILTSSDNKQDIDRMNDNEFVFKYVTKPLTEATLNEIRSLI
jgi:CheY-like chemotaxis protein